MAQLSAFLNSNKIGGVSSISEFSAGTRIFVPSLGVCGIKALSQDQFGRFAGAGSLNTLTNPGCNSPLAIMLNENSLRPVLSSNPLYVNIQSGIGNGGIDTMFGARNPGRAWTNRQVFGLNIDNSAACQTTNPSEYNYPPKQLKQTKCLQNNQFIDGLAGAKTGSGSDMIYAKYNFTGQGQ